MPVDFADHQILAGPKQNSLVGSNGNLAYSQFNVFDTANTDLNFDVYFDSNGWTDGYLRMGMMRHSFSSSMDDVPSYAQMRWQPGLAGSRSDACVNQWPVLAPKAYRGAFATGVAAYNSTTLMCEIKVGGKVVMAVPVFYSQKHTLTGSAYDTKAYHMVTRGDGTTYFFIRNAVDGKYYPMTNDIVKLERIGDTWKFTDQNDQIDTFDISGKLLQTERAGKVVALTYDTYGRMIRAADAFGNNIALDYAGDVFTLPSQTRVTSVTDSVSGRKVNLKYADAGTSYSDWSNRIKEIWSQDGADTKLSTSFNLFYNNYLAKIVEYGEDDVGAVTKTLTIAYSGGPNNGNAAVSSVTSDEGATTYEYTPTRVTAYVTSINAGVVTTNANYTDYAFYNFVQSPVTEQSGVATQTATYSTTGDLTSITTVDGTAVAAKAGARGKANSASGETVEIAFTRNAQHQLASSKITTQGVSNTFRYGYDGQRNRPNKILKDNELTILTYDDKGRVAESLRAVLTAPANGATGGPRGKAGSTETPADQVEFEKLKRDDFVGRSDISVSRRTHQYDDKGQEISSTDGAGNVTGYEYDDKGHRTVTIKADGTRVDKRRPEVEGNASVRGKVGARTAWANSTLINARAAATQIHFVGGAGDGSLHTNTKDYADNYGRTYTLPFVNWNSYSNLEGVLGTGWGDPFLKVRTNLVAVGHSWGGDSVVEASKMPDANVDLLVTVDPVGTFDWNDGSNYWVSVYADPGPVWSVIWHTKRVCAWKGRFCKTIKWPTWDYNWNGSDWTAWAGGKGWYSSLDEGDANYDAKVNYNGHHGDFKAMVNTMERNQVFFYGISCSVC